MVWNKHNNQDQTNTWSAEGNVKDNWSNNNNSNYQSSFTPYPPRNNGSSSVFSGMLGQANSFLGEMTAFGNLAKVAANLFGAADAVNAPVGGNMSTANDGQANQNQHQHMQAILGSSSTGSVPSGSTSREGDKYEALVGALNKIVDKASGVPSVPSAPATSPTLPSQNTTLV